MPLRKKEIWVTFLCYLSVFHSQTGKLPYPSEKLQSQITKVNNPIMNNGYFVQSQSFWTIIIRS